MQVILKQDVDNLGFAYEVVNVKAGYGRNYLIPQGLGQLATKEAKDKLEKLLIERAADEKAMIDEANTLAEKIKSTDIKLAAKVGEGDKIFGSLNNGDLAAALANAGVEIEKKYIKIPGNTIKRLGDYTAKIRLHRLVEIDFNFEVVPQEKK